MEDVSVYDVVEALKVIRSTGFEVPAKDPEAMEAERIVGSVDGFTETGDRMPLALTMGMNTSNLTPRYL